MQWTAEATVSRPWWLRLPGLPVYDDRLFGALRDSQLGSGQKEWAGEEALHWESSVFGDGRSAPRMVLADRRNSLGCESDPRSFYGAITRLRLRRSQQ